MKKVKIFAVICLLSLPLVWGCVEVENNAQINQLLGALGSSGAVLDENTIAAGLRQALQVGGERAVDSAANGAFNDDARVKIPLPQQLQTVASALRAVGLGVEVDNFETQMNRAASAAVVEAKPVLLDAVKQMSLTDVMNIYNGGNSAATDYFRRKTSATLQQRFKPVVHEKMQQTGVYATYAELLQQYNALPFASKPSLDLEDYLTSKTTDGLFTLMADEEAKIRTNPAARSTELLQQVFGSN